MSDGERPAWAVRLQAEREARGWNKREMARQLHKAAGNQHAPVDSLSRQIRGWEAGNHFPRDWAAAYATAFGMEEADVFGPRPETTRELHRAGCLMRSGDIDEGARHMVRVLEGLPVAHRTDGLLRRTALVTLTLAQQPVAAIRRPALAEAYELLDTSGDQ
jgi:hypothetical protein